MAHDFSLPAKIGDRVRLAPGVSLVPAGEVERSVGGLTGTVTDMRGITYNMLLDDGGIIYCFPDEFFTPTALELLAEIKP